jgi:hypothetical protein
MTTDRSLSSLLAPHCSIGYSCAVVPEANHAPQKLWKPHPDDEADVRDAIEAVERGEILSVEVSEAFLRWLEGSGDESWRDECG